MWLHGSHILGAGSLMATTIGVRELKNQVSRIVRSVREEMAEYVITVNGEPVAVIRPYSAEDKEADRKAHVEKALAEMKELAEQIGAAWNSPLSAAEAVAEQRRY